MLPCSLPHTEFIKSNYDKEEGGKLSEIIFFSPLFSLAVLFNADSFVSYTTCCSAKIQCRKLIVS